MFSIVEFLSDDEDILVEMVPTNWLVNNNKTYWPPEKFKNKIGNFIKNRKEPHETWPIHAIKVMSKADTYEEGRRKLMRAKNGTDNLTSDPKALGRGMRTKRRRSCSLTFSSDEAEDDIIPNRKLQKLLKILPPAPSSQAEPEHECDSENASDSEIVAATNSQLFFHKTSTPKLKHMELDLHLPSSSSKNHNQTHLPSSSKNHHRTHLPSSTKNHHQTHLPSSTKISKEKKGDLELILFNQKFIQIELKELWEAVTRLADQNISATSSGVKEPDLGTFPLNDTSSVKMLEEKLLDSVNKVYFVKKLRSYGGSMFQEHTRRVLRFLFTDNLAEQYNWQGSGKKQKQQFSALQVCKIIVDAVCEEQGVSRANVEEVIKTWLRHAKERKDYVKKSELV